MSEEPAPTVLVRRAAAGDRGAFAALVTPCLPELARLCRRLAGPALADDCVQDTLLLALLRLASLREPDAFVWWLRGIAIRVCRRARARVASEAQLAVDEPPGMWLPGPGLEPTLEDALVNADLGRSVRAALAALPAGQRRAVELFYLADLSYEESAAVLGIPVGALKTRLHKARAALAHRFRLADEPRARPRRVNDRALSVHEAAHAVVGWLEGGFVARIAITPRAGPYFGVVHGVGPPDGARAAAHMAILMAGEAGVALAQRRREPSDSGDRAAAARVARAATGGDDVEAALFVSDALRAARERLTDPRVWSLVERVAARLIEVRALDGDEFRTLVTH